MPRYFSIFTTFVLAYGLAPMSSVASAAIISVDDPDFGTGALTRDTDQGLDFLDLTKSTNRSYNDVSAHFGASGDFEGFRYATTAEVIALINNYGFLPAAVAGDPIIRFEGTAGDQLSGLANLLGVTYSISSFRLSDGLVFTPAGANAHRVYISDRTHPVESDTVWISDFARDGTNPGVGSFLVKDSSTGQVPEPSSHVIFGGLAFCIAAAGWWRKRQSGAREQT